MGAAAVFALRLPAPERCWHLPRLPLAATHPACPPPAGTTTSQSSTSRASLPLEKKVAQVTVFDRRSRAPFVAAISNVGVERDFNRIDAKGYTPDHVEKGMAEIEHELSECLDRIIATKTFTTKRDRIGLINLVALLHHRNPREREVLRDFHERLTDKIFQITFATPERWNHQKEKIRAAGIDTPDVPYEFMKRFVQNKEYRLDLPPGYHVDIELSTFNDILPVFFERKWMLLKAPNNSGGFVTSDHPSCLSWSHGPPDNLGMGPGLASKGSELLFPVSRRLALFGSFEIEDGEGEANEDLVARFNSQVICRSSWQVYAHDVHFSYRFGDQI